MRIVFPSVVPLDRKDIYAIFHSLSAKRNTVKIFERRFAKYLDVKYAYAVSSGRAGLYIILKSLKKRANKDEVIVPDFVCPSVASAVLKAGCKIILCDVLKKNFAIDPDKLKSVINKKTLACVLAYMYGLPTDVVKIKQILKESNAYLIEDVAQGLGASIDSKKLGSFGDFSFFSFGKSKVMTTMTGGMVCTDSDELANGLEKELIDTHISYSASHITNHQLPIAFLLQTIAYALFPYIPFSDSLVSHSVEKDFIPDFEVSSLSNSKASLGISMLKKLDEMNRKREESANCLIEKLIEISGIFLPGQKDGFEPIYLRLPILTESREARDNLYELLFNKGVISSFIFPEPLHRISEIDCESRDTHFPNSEYIADRILTLPTHPLVKKRDLETMIKVIKRYGKSNIL